MIQYKIISLMFSIVFLISLVSASDVEISPSTIHINGYPGQIIEKNITITTSGNYAVYLEATNVSGITTIFPSPIIVERQKEVTIYFTLADDIEPKNYSISLTARTDAPTEVKTETIIEYISSGGSGGVLYKYKNNTIYVKNETGNNLEDLKAIEDLKKTNTDLQDKNKNLESDKGSLIILAYILGGLFIFEMLFLIYKYFIVGLFNNKPIIPNTNPPTNPETKPNLS